MAGERFVWTKELIEKAEKLRAGPPRMQWKDIAERLGCDERSLQTTVSRRRLRRSKEFVDRWEQERAEIEHAVIDQKQKLSQVARDRGVSVASISQRLKRMGLDKEVREELLGKRRVQEV